MRWHRYKCENCHKIKFQMYIMACRAHFCHLLGLGQVGHCPRGMSWEYWDPGLGPNVVRLPVHLPPQYIPYTPDIPKQPSTPPSLLLSAVFN